MVKKKARSSPAEIIKNETNVFDLFQQGLRTNEIAKILGQNQTWVSFYLKRLGLSKPKRELWTEEELSILTNNYYSCSMESLLLMLPKRTWHCIQNKTQKLGLIRDKKFQCASGKLYSEFEKQYLRDNFSSKTRQEILSVLYDRSWSSIVSQARQLNLHREINEQQKADLSVLLNETPLTFYWLGFLFADGSLAIKDRKNNRKVLSLSLGLQEKDKEHLLKFCSYIGKDPSNLKIKTIKPRQINGRSLQESRQYKVYASNNKVLELFSKKYDFKPRKTYNPPSWFLFSNYDEKLILSFLVGFIDGDGHIKRNRRHGYSIIKCHGNWSSFFENLVVRLNIIYASEAFKFGMIKSNNSFFATICCYRKPVLMSLKKFIVDHSLPAMDRKWDRIQLNCAPPENPCFV